MGDADKAAKRIMAASHFRLRMNRNLSGNVFSDQIPNGCQVGDYGRPSFGVQCPVRAAVYYMPVRVSVNPTTQHRMNATWPCIHPLPRTPLVRYWMCLPYTVTPNWSRNCGRRSRITPPSSVLIRRIPPPNISCFPSALVFLTSPYLALRSRNHLLPP